MAFGLHTLLSFRGKIGVSGDVIEDWSFGIRIAGTSAPNDTTVVAPSGMTAAHDAAQVLFNTAAMKFGTNVTFNEVRGYRIDAAGHARGPVALAPSVPPIPGLSASNHHPWQCSTVVSLVSTGTGHGRKGRVYLPPQGLAVDDTGHISTADATAIRTAMSNFLTSIVTPAYEGTPTRLVIASKTYGTLNTVDRTRVGLVIDTQRRRRNKEVEHYVEGGWPS